LDVLILGLNRFSASVAYTVHITIVNQHQHQREVLTVTISTYKSSPCHIVDIHNVPSHCLIDINTFLDPDLYQLDQHQFSTTRFGHSTPLGWTRTLLYSEFRFFIRLSDFSFWNIIFQIPPLLDHHRYQQHLEHSRLGVWTVSLQTCHNGILALRLECMSLFWPPRASQFYWTLFWIDIDESANSMSWSFSPSSSALIQLCPLQG